MIEKFKQCMNIEDINISIKQTFEFIKAHQFKDGVLTQTTVSLNVSLIEDQLSGSNKNKVTVTNSAIGEIHRVSNSYVVVKTTNSCGTKQSYYFIAFSKIVYIGSVVVEKNFDQYLAYINQLPELCNENCTSKGKIITEMKKAIIENYDSNKYLQYIYNGIRSDSHDIKSYIFARNLLTVTKFYITPVTIIDGFALIPKCE